MRPLFVGGCPRSGTSALTNYLNHHPEILVCRERYKYLPAEAITPELFTFERILAFDPSETNMSREGHVDLLGRKVESELKWIGDKNPDYARKLPELAENNPGARFIVLYRPVEEVAESFEARAADPTDRWPRENGFERGIDRWNSSLRHTRRFITRSRTRQVLVVEYHRFFGDPESVIPLLSEFLGLDFDERVRSAWATLSGRFGRERRQKHVLTPPQSALVQERKDAGTERWVLDYIREQGTPKARWPGSAWRRGRAAVGERVDALRR